MQALKNARGAFRGALAVVFAAVVAVGTLGSGVTSYAAEGVTTQLEKAGKTATDLDGNLESTVTLSVPSAEESLASEIVFVMDGSSSAADEVVEQSLSLLEELKASVSESGAAVNVCIVKFKRQAFKSEWFDLSKDFDAIESAMQTKYSGGTNIHAGLLAGKEALDEHEDVSAARKYLILISDGSTYLYSKDGDWASDTPYTRSYYSLENYRNAAGGFNDQGLYNPDAYSEVNVTRPKDTSDVDAWKSYLADVKARNAESNGDSYDYHCNYDLNFNQGIPSDDFKSQPCEKRTANNRDMAFYYADQVWQQIKDAGYNAYSIATEDGSAGAGNADDSHSFMNYLNDGASLDFSDIKNEVFYAVGAGSTVEDKMGTSFDFVPGSLKLSVGNVELESKSEGNVTYFGAKDASQDISGENYRFKVVYDSAADEFTWTFNENVSNFAPVKLTYRVKLVNVPTEPGTYTFETNESAVLYPCDSMGNEGDSVEFPVPTVSYTVSEQDPQPKTPTSGDGQKQASAKKPGVPKTGDPSSCVALIAAGAAGVAACAASVVSRSRRG